MILDTKEQRDNLIRCIHVAAASLPRDASDGRLADLAVLVKLRHDVEGGIITGVTETTGSRVTHGAHGGAA